MIDEQVKLVVEGVDGSQWVIHGPGSGASPVRLLAGDVGELVDAPFSTTYQPVSGRPGSSFRAVTFPERNVVLNLNIAGDSGDSWARVDSRFRQALSPEEPARLVAITPQSGRRWLNVRLAEHPQLKNSLDPHEQANAVMQYVLVAGDPYWYSQELRDEFVFDGSNWVGGGVTVANPGDVPAWPKWVLTAPAKFGLPDVDLSTPVDARLDRFVYLPFQPTGREVVVDADPFEELIATTDGTLLWAQMNGQFFENPIPPRTTDTVLPVYVDPFPLFPFDIPATWRIWIAEKLSELVALVGLEEVLAMTPEDVGTRIAEWLAGVRPDWLDPILPETIDALTADAIARVIRETYGRFGNIAGATAQVRIQPRWTRPWGME